MGIQRFEDLEVWQRAHELVLDVYRLTADFPDHEKYGLVSQMRRAAVSIPANIAEGFRRRGRRDKIHFYNISQGSLEEVRYFLRLASDLEYLTEYERPAGQVDQIGRMLHGLIVSIERATVVVRR